MKNDDSLFYESCKWWQTRNRRSFCAKTVVAWDLDDTWAAFQRHVGRQDCSLSQAQRLSARRIQIERSRVTRRNVEANTNDSSEISNGWNLEVFDSCADQFVNRVSREHRVFGCGLFRRTSLLDGIVSMTKTIRRCFWTCLRTNQTRHEQLYLTPRRRE